ncbi:MAG: HD domain-containing protein [Planctomycetes bacterium]|nr:HD domain-containing protein [Planctomycetota bacterium]
MLIAEGPQRICESVKSAVADLTPIVCTHSADASRKAWSSRDEAFPLALVDLNHGEGRGLEIAAELLAFSPSTRVLIYGENPTADQLLAALNGGIAGFLHLPLDLDLLRDKLQAALRDDKSAGGLQASLREQTKVLRRTRRAGLLALAKLAEHRDTETGLHVERVSAFSAELANELSRSPAFEQSIDAEFIDAIRVAAALHDIGKVAIPDEILRKPGRLTAEEFETVKSHSMIGWQVIQSARAEDSGHDPVLDMAAVVCRNHHERWDGSGYPDKLQGDAIPLAARIVAVIDAFDAMRSARVYNPERTSQETGAEILRCRGTHFDPAIIDIFLPNIEAFENLGRMLDRKSARWK